MLRNEDSHERTPEGYDFLPKKNGGFLLWPHPNSSTSGRTRIAKQLLEAITEAGGDRAYRIFAIILFRYHGTPEAGKNLEGPLRIFARGHEDRVSRLAECLRKLYAEGSLPFSEGDSRHIPNRNAKFVLQSLDQWYLAAVDAAAKLADPATTPASWHTYFLKEMLPKMRGFGHC